MTAPEEHQLKRELKLTDAASGSRINGLISGDGSPFWHQALAVLAVIGLTAALTCGLGIVIRATIGLRATGEQEELGLGGMFQDTGSPAPLEQVQLATAKAALTRRTPD